MNISQHIITIYTEIVLIIAIKKNTTNIEDEQEKPIPSQMTTGEQTTLGHNFRYS